MLRKLRDFHAWTVETCDDRVVGRVDDFLIDDENWAVRYLVVGTGQSFPERHMLISTRSVEGIDWDGMRIVTDLTRGQVHGNSSAFAAASTKGLSSLRSVRALRGCRVHATNGQIGRIDDVFADDERWSIPYLEITAGHSVEGAMLIPPDWIRTVDWTAGVVSVEAVNHSVATANHKVGNNLLNHSWRPAPAPAFAARR
jgi:hypothetical protein